MTMKHFLAIFLLAACATASAQTVKTLGYNTTNGQVVYSGTNTLTFTNAFTVATNAVAEVRTNLSLGATWLTNTNAMTFLNALGLTVEINATNLTLVRATEYLYDETGQQGALKGDDGEFSTSASFVTTNAPTDTTNAVRWLILTEDTNSYRIPLFQ